VGELHHLITGVRSSRRETGETAPPVATGEPALDVRGLTTRQLDDVTFSVAPGEVVGVTGLIGSGRSELGRVLYGLQRYAGGEIRFDGRAARAPVSEARTSRSVAYTPQERRAGILSKLSVQENATIASFEGLTTWYGLSGNRVREAAMQVIEALKVRPPEPSKLIDLLSGGNQQKVVLGKWLRLPLRLIILDEPTQSIDIGAKADLMGEMRERARRDGLAVLWLESDVEELVKYADRVLVMRAGRIIEEFTERPFAVAEIVAACYGQPVAEVS
jgi:ribose transport system ATP-binding protein